MRIGFFVSSLFAASLVTGAALADNTTHTARLNGAAPDKYLHTDTAQQKRFSDFGRRDPSGHFPGAGVGDSCGDGCSAAAGVHATKSAASPSRANAAGKPSGIGSVGKASSVRQGCKEDEPCGSATPASGGSSSGKASSAGKSTGSIAPAASHSTTNPSRGDEAGSSSAAAPPAVASSKSGKESWGTSVLKHAIEKNSDKAIGDILKKKMAGKGIWSESNDQI